MTVDLPENFSSKKLPILDMKCWIDEEGVAQYMHYEKDVASKQIIPERSAHSNSNKRSVHISEIDELNLWYDISIKYRDKKPYTQYTYSLA